jgi:SH3-like domain-containing protein
MSAIPGPKKVLSANIDEDNAPSHDLLITWAASIPTDRLQPYDEWIRAGKQTGTYNGPSPSYHLKFDWNAVKDDVGPVEVVNQAMERCFGTRDANGWEVWIRGDQLNILVGDFRKEYLRLKGLAVPQAALLEIWVDDLVTEFKRM